MIIRNNIAAFLWCFSTIFILLVSAMTIACLKDGVPSGYSPIFIYFVLLLFWIVGFALTLYAAGKACLSVTLQADGRVSIVKSYPFKKEERTIMGSELNPATIHKSTDDEGTSYFCARVTLRDGTFFDIAEGHDLKSCQSVCTRFNALLWPDDSDAVR